MRILFLFIFSISCIYANIGVVVDSVGSSTLLRSGELLKVIQKTKIKVHDTIFTKKGARVKIFFKDDTVVSLGERTSFEVDSYFYKDNDKKSNVKFRVLKGFFKAVTGKISKIAPQRFKLQTKNATIGIRGTVFAAQVGDKVDVTICTDGTIVITTETGSYELSKGGVARVSKSAPPKISKYSQKLKKEIVKKSGWQGSMTQNELKKYIEKIFKEPVKSQLLGAIDNIFKKDSSEKRGTESAKNDSKNKTADAESIGFIDDITINGREFDELPRHIEFYTEDLKGGKVTISGLLESDKKSVPVDDLSVAVSLDGGDTWKIANGHADWEYKFYPKIGKTYELSLKVVKKSTSDTQDNSNDMDIPHILNINGFILTLGDDVSIENGRLRGSGTLFIPILQTISSTASIDVNFNNLQFSNGVVTVGDIEYNEAINLQTDVADISISKLTVSPVIANNKIEGKVTFKGDFSFLPAINLADTSALLPSSFSLVVPVQVQEFSILPSHSVKFILSSGNIKINYALGDSTPTLDISSLNAKLDFGDILQTAVGSASSVVANLQSIASSAGSYALNLERGVKAYLYGKSILLENLGLSFNIKDKSVHVESGIDFSGYDNPVAERITDATMSADISPGGFSGEISASASLEPIVILERGGVGKDVRITFGENTSVSLSLGDSDVDIDFEGFDMSVDFGDVLKSGTENVGSIVANLSKIDGAYFLNLPQGTKAYLLGQNILLEGLDLSFDMDKKSVHISSSVD
ncbi:MAG: FecR family protein, partial [Sulfurospirillum sp.]